jgi:hypothetical protein
MIGASLMQKADYFTFTAPGIVELLSADLNPTLPPGWLEVEAECSLVSPGTERSILSYPCKPAYSHVGGVVRAVPEAEQMFGLSLSM